MFLLSDVVWSVYSVVTDAITIRQVLESGQLVFAYILLAILMLPFASMFLLTVRVSLESSHNQIGSSTWLHDACGSTDATTC